jgi:hypothetical protein
MADARSVDEVRAAARAALAALGGLAGPRDLAEAKALVEPLRNQRDHLLMGELAEAISRRDPADATNRRLYAQALIENGRATAAADMLRALATRLPAGHPEWIEAHGLLGRAYKQIFFDTSDRDAPFARDALAQAIAAYRAPYAADRANTWHGVNLVALLHCAATRGLVEADGLDADAVAAQVIATLEAQPAEARDAWHLPTLAEASLALRDWMASDRHMRAYVGARDARAFQIASTLRQLTEIWELDRRDERGRALAEMLRARLMQLPGGIVQLPPSELQRVREQSAPTTLQLEAILGPNGAQTYRWWKTGVERAAAVASIRQKMGGRIGTGFLLRAGDLGRTPADELVVLTNWHVVNDDGVSPGVRPEEAEVCFEAANDQRVYAVREILWRSGVERHDASLLRLAEPVTDVQPLPIAASLPLVDETARVYVIGHPGGRDLAFSFQDNELLDHEGPPHGAPGIAGVRRVHYRAPTEGGSSGSPVFNSRLWQVIALHHKGGKIGMPRLNGKEGTYGANEGISMCSIIAAMREG